MSRLSDYLPPHYEDADKDRERVRKRTFKRSPCGRPPEQPQNLRGAFDRSGSGRHLRIRARLRWREVTEDTSGFVIRIKHYVVEVEYTPNGADWFLADRFLAGKRYPSAEGRLTLTAATNPSGTTFRYAFSGNHGLDTDDNKLTIRGCSPQVEYNGEFNITSIVNPTTVEVNSGGATGIAACTNPGWGEALQELYNWNPEKPHTTFAPVHKDLGYRYRVRAVAQDDCRSAWSDWKVIGNPGADEPPAPTLVKIVDRDKHMRVTLSWVGEESPDDSDLFDDQINHFIAEISENSGFGTNYKKDRGVKGNRISFRIDDADENSTFYGRVRSVSADKDKSAWIPATLAGNSDSGAAASGVSVGKAMEKTKAPKAPTGVAIAYDENDGSRPNGRWRAKVIWNEVVADVDNNDVDITSYAVQFQQSDNGTSWTNDPRRDVIISKDDDLDTTAYKIFHNINQKKFYRARVRAISESGTKGAYSSWTANSAGPSTAAVPTPINVTIHHKTKPKDRVIIDWDAPVDAADADLPDSRVDYFQVVIKKNSTTPTTLASGFKFDRMVRATERHFRVAKVDEDATWYGWVRTIDVEGNKSTWIPATTAGNSSAGATASGIETDDGVHIGRVVKHAGATIPQGYLRANGQTVSTSTYPLLFAEINYDYGGSGATFAVPDHRKRQARGVGTSQAPGDSEGLAEGSRDEDHGTHPNATHKNHKKDHKHKHKHRHKHGKHGNTGHGHGDHDHGIGVGITGAPNTGTAGIGSSSGGSGTPTDLTRIGHMHSHSFPNGTRTRRAKDTSGDGSAGMPDYMPSIAGTDVNEDGLTDGHRDANTQADNGAADLYTDSLSGLLGQYSGSPTNSVGTLIELDDADAGGSTLGAGNAGHGDHAKPSDDDGVRGHRKHPFLRVHYNIKAY